MRGDPYPTVRHLAWRSLRQVAPFLERDLLDRFVPSDQAIERGQVIDALEAQAGARCRSIERSIVGSLRGQAAEVAIEVGE
jgi:hypothetical protein